MKRHNIVIRRYGERRVEICGDPVAGSKISVIVRAMAPNCTNLLCGPVISFALLYAN